MKKAPIQFPNKEDYDNLVNLLAVVTEASDQLADIQARIDAVNREAVDQIREDYIELQKRKAEAEESIETLARRNPAWFAKAKTVTTPYGSVKLTETSSIKAANEDASIILIAQAGREDFIRRLEELDLEALAKCDDAQLALFGLVRSKAESCKITPAKVNLGKAVESAKEAA